MAKARARQTLLAAVDYSEAGATALEAALAIAASRGAPLHVVSVLGGYDPMKKLELAYETRRLDLEAERSKLVKYIQTELERYRAAHGEVSVETTPHVLAGPAAKEIARVAASVHADLVVVGSHGRRGVRRMVLGSVAEEVLRVAPCPVLVMRHKDWSQVRA